MFMNLIKISDMEQSYKEKYEDILARLERAKNDNDVCDERYCCVIDEIIPELADSKDERIRKELIDAIQGLWDNDALPMPLSVKRKDEWIAWLEKQAEVKESHISQHENRTCEENGNSLTYEDERIRKEIINYFRCQSEEEPTRKEIHDKWIAWLENIPYTIDHEKREGFHLGYKACLEKQGEQKPTEWSEEDKNFMYDTLSNLTELKDRYGEGYGNVGRCIDWILKSIRPHDTWKPSDVQIECLSDAIEHYNSLGYPASKLKELLDDLKKLKEGEV